MIVAGTELIGSLVRNIHWLWVSYQCISAWIGVLDCNPTSNPPKKIQKRGQHGQHWRYNQSFHPFLCSHLNLSGRLWQVSWKSMLSPCTWTLGARELVLDHSELNLMGEEFPRFCGFETLWTSHLFFSPCADGRGVRFCPKYRNFGNSTEIACLGIISHLKVARQVGKHVVSCKLATPWSKHFWTLHRYPKVEFQFGNCSSKELPWISRICNTHTLTIIYIYIYTSSTAQGGGGSFRIGNL